MASKPVKRWIESATYQYPLRRDTTVTISNVPTDMTLEEAARLEAFLKTLVQRADLSKAKAIAKGGGEE